MALAVPLPTVRPEPEDPAIPSIREEARVRKLTAEQLEDLLALWEEFYWFPPRNLHELDAELAR